MKTHNTKTFSLLFITLLSFFAFFLSGCMSPENPDQENFEEEYQEPSFEEEQEKMFQDAQSK
jgi:PBP1b-binding outer membrane lipoprotein LpoB